MATVNPVGGVADTAPGRRSHGAPHHPVSRRGIAALAASTNASGAGDPDEHHRPHHHAHHHPDDHLDASRFANPLPGAAGTTQLKTLHEKRGRAFAVFSQALAVGALVAATCSELPAFDEAVLAHLAGPNLLEEFVSCASVRDKDVCADVYSSRGHEHANTVVMCVALGFAGLTLALACITVASLSTRRWVLGAIGLASSLCCVTLITFLGLVGDAARRGGEHHAAGFVLVSMAVVVSLGLAVWCVIVIVQTAATHTDDSLSEEERRKLAANHGDVFAEEQRSAYLRFGGATRVCLAGLALVLAAAAAATPRFVSVHNSFREQCRCGPLVVCCSGGQSAAVPQDVKDAARITFAAIAVASAEFLATCFMNHASLIHVGGLGVGAALSWAVFGLLTAARGDNGAWEAAVAVQALFGVAAGLQTLTLLVVAVQRCERKALSSGDGGARSSHTPAAGLEQRSAHEPFA